MTRHAPSRSYDQLHVHVLLLFREATTWTFTCQFLAEILGGEKRRFMKLSHIELKTL